jgi:hypothetical protein
MSEATSPTLADNPADALPASVLSRVNHVILELIGNIPLSEEPIANDPGARIKQLTNAACWKAATVSGTLSLPVGPLGMVTILPDLYAIWKIQARLVSDIANVLGKKPVLTRETMLYCLFRHAASQLMRDLVSRVGERIVVKATNVRFLDRLLQRLGIVITGRVAGRTFSRWMPVVGAVGVGVYAYKDTAQVARTAVELFTKTVEVALPAPQDASHTPDPSQPTDPSPEAEAIPSPS